MCWYHANSSPPYPPCRCQAPAQSKKNRKILGQCAGIMQTVLHLTPPLADVRLLSKNREKHREIERFCPKPKKPREIEKKRKKTKDSGTMCWYHVNILLARLFFVLFRFLEVSFGFGQNLSISRCFLILDGFFRILNAFFDFGHLLLISRCF